MAKYKKDAKSGLYYAYVPTGFYNLNGTTEYKKIRAKDTQKLDKKIAKFITDREMGVIIDSDKITVEQWAKNWLKSYRSNGAENSTAFYEDMLNHIIPAIGKRKLKSIMEIDLQNLLNKLSNSTYGPKNKKYAKKTVKEVRSVLFSLFETAKNNRLILGNPATNLKINGAPSKKRRELTEEERQKYINCCFFNEFGLYSATLYYLGLRRGEALALKHSDFGDKYVKISRQFVYPNNSCPVETSPKTDAGVREIFIPENLQAMLYIWGAGKNYNGNPDDYIFQDTNGNPLSYSTYRRKWNNFIKEALGEETEITPHYLRHNYCTLLYDSGVDVQTARAFMGHADIKTTLEIYTHLTSKQRIKSSEKIINI